MGLLENKFSDNIVTTTVDSVLNWGTNTSMFSLILGTACCGIEMMAVGYSRFDVLERFGMLFRFSPRQSDLMLVAGTVTKKMAPVVKTIYDQMSEPRWVIAVGSCAISGNIYNSYSTLQGVDRIIPVDLYIPGCPPVPEAITYGIMELNRQISQGRRIRKQVSIVDPTAQPRESVDLIKRPGYVKMPTAADYAAHLGDETLALPANLTQLLASSPKESE
ncbi:MAG: NADH-quinone oxidoreductase subunit B [Chloroflexi bacterium]|nr:NADH-quinone oxidoreductase subunit B [Chloroflexota bacterium]